jgi:N-acetylglutamate synthase
VSVSHANAAAAAAWVSAMESLIAVTPQARSRRGGHGTHLLLTGVPLATLNAVFSVNDDPDADEVADFAASLDGAQSPWSIQVRGEPSPRVVETAATHGLTAQTQGPFMTRHVDAGILPQEPAALRVRTATAADHQVFLEVLSSGFGVPPEMFGPLASAALLDAPGFAAYLGEEDGVPVASGLGVLGAGHVGVFNIATVPRSQRRGYGRAMTTAVLRDGYAAGADTAFLHPTAAGLPVYESLGFRTAEHWTYFTAS